MTTPCTDNPELFFSDDRRNIATAKAICADCPTRLACLQLAIDGKEQYGIWGALTAGERDRLRPASPTQCAFGGCDEMTPLHRQTGKPRKFCRDSHSKSEYKRDVRARMKAAS